MNLPLSPIIRALRFAHSRVKKKGEGKIVIIVALKIFCSDGKLVIKILFHRLKNIYIYIYIINNRGPLKLHCTLILASFILSQKLSIIIYKLY